MSGLTIAYSLFFYLAIDIFLVGFLMKVWKFASTPAPLKIPQTPAPTTAPGVGSRVFQEVVFFKALFRGNKTLWLGGYAFHLGLLLVFFKHLRFMIPATPAFFSYFVTFDLYSGFVLFAALAFLFIIRFAVDRHRYISVANDYILLLFLMAIASTGLLSRFWSGGGVRSSVPDIKEFVVGLLAFKPGTLPENKLFLVHFSLVMLLLIYFPFSKLMHSIGIFFSPTRNQIDNARSKRWVNPWAARRPRVGEAPRTVPTPPIAREES